MPLDEQVLGGFKSGMSRSSRRGGKDGAQKLWTLQNGYVTDQGDAVPRPGLQHVANVAHSVGLYGADGQLHVFYGDDDAFVDPGNPLVKGHILRYPLDPSATALSYLETVLADEPYLLYPMNDPTDTAIETIQAANGTYGGTDYARQRPSLLPNGEGKSGQFNSTDATVTTPALAHLAELQQPFTLECWAEVDQDTPDSAYYEFFTGVGTLKVDFRTDYSGRLYLRRKDSISSFDLTSAPGSFTFHQPHYVVVTSGPTSMSLYVDSLLVLTTAWPLESTTPTDPTPFLIGRMSDGSTACERRLQFVAVYDKVLNQSDIVRHWLAAQS